MAAASLPLLAMRPVSASAQDEAAAQLDKLEREFGGRLEIRSGPHGTTIVATIPLSAGRHWSASGEYQRARPARATADQLE